MIEKDHDHNLENDKKITLSEDENKIIKEIKEELEYIQKQENDLLNLF